MKPNWTVNILVFIEEVIRIVMGLCLVIHPLIAVDHMMSEPYCDVAHRDNSALTVENPAHVLCDVLIFFLRAFGWFNFAFGLFLELGRRQLYHANNKTGWFVFVAWITHLAGIIFEVFLKPDFTTNPLAVLWHSSFSIFYSFCLYKYAN